MLNWMLYYLRILGKIHKASFNDYEDVHYYKEAIAAEEKLENPRNLILDYCDLLVCLTKINDNLARTVLYEIDSTISKSTDLHLENVFNVKAI
jgi:hypothetical protein